MDLNETIRALEGLLRRGDLTPDERRALVLTVTALNDRSLLTCGWCIYHSAPDESRYGPGTCRRNGMPVDLGTSGCRFHLRLGQEEKEEELVEPDDEVPDWVPKKREERQRE